MRRSSAFALVVFFVIGCGKKGPSSTEMPRLNALEAMTASAQLVSQGTEDWKLAFLSNTGVSGNPIIRGEHFRTQADALMLPDGTAGQWVVELFLDKPQRQTRDGHAGLWYPFRKFVVSARATDGQRVEVNVHPEADSVLGVPEKLTGLNLATAVDGLDAARKRAIAQVKDHFDVLSVFSEAKPSGDPSWRFRFYDVKTQEIVAKVRVSGDGTKVLDW